MKVRTPKLSCGAVLMISLTSAGLCGSSVLPASAAGFQQTNLVSDIPGLAQITDPDLVNAWGISQSSGSPFWISDNGTGLSTLYAVPGSGPPSVMKQGLIVTMQPGSSAPTGQVFNSTGGFNLTNGNGSPALFLFASEDGAISGWNPGAGTSNVIQVNSPDAVYKGLAISNFNSSGGPVAGTLYATNFHSGAIDAFDSSFMPTLAGADDFVDPSLPKGYAPFNDSVINGKLYVTYAMQDLAKHDDVPGLGHGFVDIFNLDGTGEQRLVSGGALDSPWGLALAPAGFGPFGGDLLVGNFGNGMINAYDATTGAWLGALDGTDGNPLAIDGLWGLKFGNGAAGGGSLSSLYFTAGPNGESDGLFGSLTAVPEPSTWAMMLAGFAGLASAAYRRSRRSDAAAALA